MNDEEVWRPVHEPKTKREEELREQHMGGKEGDTRNMYMKRKKHSVMTIKRRPASRVILKRTKKFGKKAEKLYPVYMMTVGATEWGEGRADSKTCEEIMVL